MMCTERRSVRSVIIVAVVGRGIVVGVVTGLWAGRSEGVRFLAGVKNLSFIQNGHTGSEAYPVALF